MSRWGYRVSFAGCLLESLAVARPLWETGLWAADTGRQGSRGRLSGVPYCWGGVSHSTGTGGAWPGKEWSVQHPCQWPHMLPHKSEAQGQCIWSTSSGSPGLSVPEGVARVFCLFLLCSQQFPIHLLQWVVHIVPTEMSVPLCLGAQDQGHIDHSADQQQEN